MLLACGALPLIALLVIYCVLCDKTSLLLMHMLLTVDACLGVTAGVHGMQWTCPGSGVPRKLR